MAFLHSKWIQKGLLRIMSPIRYTKHFIFICNTFNSYYIRIKMMPDDDKVVEDSKIPLATKLALLLGLMPQNNLGGTLSDVGPGHFLMSSEFSNDKDKV